MMMIYPQNIFSQKIVSEARFFVSYDRGQVEKKKKDEEKEKEDDEKKEREGEEG